jgi:membrane-bound lytic murein transglycosylase D
LRIDGYVDERRDPVKSTEAAARYLRDLYDMFNDWHLSLAAYNTGEGNISRIMERRGASDYWDMRENGYIVRETREYVPRFLAALQIARSPEEYGFSRPEDEPLTFDWVRVNRSLSLEKVAQLCGTSGKEIQELNPALTRGVVPQNGYTLRIPKGMKRSFMEAAARLPAERYVAKSAGKSHASASGSQKRSPASTHRVRSGETLGTIAARYGTTQSALARNNGMRNANRLRAGQVLQIPGRSGTKSPAPKVASVKAAPQGQRRPPMTITKQVPAVTDPPRRNTQRTHQVRAGETAAAIAKRYGVSLNDLLRANGVRDARRIQVGRVLVVPSSAGRAAAARAPSQGKKTANATYTVRSGDTLSSIAQRHGVSVSALCSVNGLRQKSNIRPGQKLRIPKQVASK